jgi:hypothetical protein
VYIQDVDFREIRGKSKSEVVQTENNPEKAKFEPRDEEEDDSYESIESNEEVEQSALVVRRCKKIRKPIERYSLLDFCSAFVLISTGEEPKSVNSTEGILWKDAMVGEMESLHKNETWNLVKLPSGINHVGSKWVFKKKMNASGQVEKFNARLVAKGYSQLEGVHFCEIFSLVAKLTSIRVIMSLAATFDLEIEQMDVKKTFLHGAWKKKST